MDVATLKSYIESAWSAPASAQPSGFVEFFETFLQALESGAIRSAVKDSEGWKVNSWVKQGILLGFRFGKNMPVSGYEGWHFYDKSTYPTLKPASAERNIRLVPGGSAVRRGAYLGKNVTMMPPMYVNVGAYVDDGTMVDSHALVGSCAQVGKNVHLSAAAQLGGVLEPVGATPVIVEDNCMIGGNTGIYEGTRVGEGAVIAAGVVLTRSVPVYDLVNEQIIRGSADQPLVIPAGAVVIPGSRPIRSHAWAAEHGLSLTTPVIIKYRDAKTDLATTLEALLR
jgi:2,3,4,5-tetrahydropyridine-2-carboxylate N-succinyltransferase